LIEDYRTIFSFMPQLRDLALGYWDKIDKIENEPDALEKEEALFNRTIKAIASILLDSQIFMRAMEKEKADPVEHAIIEGIYMLDIVLDVEDGKL